MATLALYGTYASVVLADAPVAYYPLATNGDDASGNGYNATPTNVTWETAATAGTGWPAAFAGAAGLNGSSSFLSMPSGVNPSGWTALSVEAWVEFTGSTGGNPRWVANGHTDSDGHGFELFTSGGESNPEFVTAGTGGAGDSTTATTTGWHFLAGTYDGTTQILYLDGVAVASAAAGGTAVQAAAHPPAIGYNPSYSGDYVPGLEAQVAIYHGVLTPTQIAAHNTAGSAAFPVAVGGGTGTLSLAIALAGDPAAAVGGGTGTIQATWPVGLPAAGVASATGDLTQAIGLVGETAAALGAPRAFLNATPYEAAVFADDPRVWYELAVNADDASGNGATATAQTGVTFGVSAPTGFGWAAMASGAATSGAVVLPTTVDFTGWTGATWEGWIARRDMATVHNQIQAWQTTDYPPSTNSGVVVQDGFANGGGNPSNLNMAVGGGTGYSQSSPQWATGSGLHHVVVTVDSTALTWYTDAQAVTSAGGLASLAMGPAPLTLNDGGQPDLFAQFAMYSGALSPARISAHFQAGMPTPAAPTNAFASAALALAPSHYWPASDPTAAQILDYAPGGYNPAYGQGAPSADIGVAPTTAGPFPGVGAMTLTASSAGWFATTQPVANPAVFTLMAAFQTTTSAGVLLELGQDQTGSNTGGGYDRILYVDSTGLLRFAVNGSTTTVASPSAVTDGVMHLAIGTMSSVSGMTLYLDGVAVGTNSNTASQNFTGWWELGGGNTNGWPNGSTNDFLNGTQSQTAVWNSTALTSADVANLWTAWQQAANPAILSGTVALATTAPTRLHAGVPLAGTAAVAATAPTALHPAAHLVGRVALTTTAPSAITPRAHLRATAAMTTTAPATVGLRAHLRGTMALAVTAPASLARRAALRGTMAMVTTAATAITLRARLAGMMAAVTATATTLVPRAHLRATTAITTATTTAVRLRAHLRGTMVMTTQSPTRLAGVARLRGVITMAVAAPSTLARRAHLRATAALATGSPTALGRLAHVVSRVAMRMGFTTTLGTRAALPPCMVLTLPVVTGLAITLEVPTGLDCGAVPVVTGIAITLEVSA